jgi:hypothetical protein
MNKDRMDRSLLILYHMAAELPHSIVAGQKLDIQMLYQLKGCPAKSAVSNGNFGVTHRIV